MRVRGLTLAACVVIGFVVVAAARSHPADPGSRLPAQYRLAGLIDRESATNDALRRQIADLRRQIGELRAAGSSRAAGQAALQDQLDRAGLFAGTVAVRGPALRVVLDDSTVKRSPTGDLNDLVIHSQDVQAAVNAVWRAGAEAVAINGERVVSTTAVLCVGNTLLLNGTVHSPPYSIVAIGASKDRFDADELVKRLKADADTFGLRFSVTREDNVEVPAYGGATSLQFARPA